MRNIIINTVGKFLDLLYRIYKSFYIHKQKTYINCNDVKIVFPFTFIGGKHITIEDNVFINTNSYISAINARVLIKKYTAIGPNLYVSTGNHKMIPGVFFSTITDSEKGIGYDKDVIIEEDVWIGANVTILNGVTIGRGSIVGAGSLVTKDVLPYSIFGGVPAKFIKFKWTKEEIIYHEDKIYSKEDKKNLDFYNVK